MSAEEFVLYCSAADLPSAKACFQVVTGKTCPNMSYDDKRLTFCCFIKKPFSEFFKGTSCPTGLNLPTIAILPSFFGNPLIPPRYALRLSVSGVPVAAATAILQLIGGKKISAATQEICDSIFIGNHPIATSAITKGFQVGNKKKSSWFWIL